MGTYYQILHVSENASAEEIKQSYRKLAKKYHPDASRTHDTSPQFHKIQRAYHTLNNPTKRRNYDRGLEYLRNKKASRHSEIPKNDNSTHQANAYLRWQKYMKRVQEDETYFFNFRKYHRAVLAASFLLVTMFFGDFVSASRHEQETILSKHYLYALTKNDSDRDYYLLQTDKDLIRINHDLGSTLKEGDIISIDRTYFFGIVKDISVEREEIEFLIENGEMKGAVGFFGFLLLVSIITTFINKKSEQIVNATLLCSLLLALNLLMLFGLID